MLGRPAGGFVHIAADEVASIKIRTETDREILDYRTRNHGDEWQDMNYPVRLT